MQKSRIVLMAALILAVFAGQAFATGTPAGTAINNKATATYEVGAQTLTKDSNTNTITVAEILNVTVTWQDASNVVVAPGDTNKALLFRITNTGNGSDSYTLAGLSAGVGGDNFDPNLLDLYFDTNGNGIYDAGVDVQYIPGSNDPTIAADGHVDILVLNNIPLALADGNLGNSRLTATSKTGTGAAGTVVAGAGESGTDAVVGSTGGTANKTGTYVVSNVVVSITKTSAVLDPFGGTQPVPGAVVTYTIAVVVSGSGTAANMVITDVIPAGTAYNAGTLTLNTVPLTDAADADKGDVGATTAGTVTVHLGSLTSASAQQNIVFKVTLQ